jgi:hypothetical protein
MNVLELRSHWPLIIFAPMIIPLLVVAGPCIYHETKQRGRRCQALTGKYLANVSGGGMHGGVAQMMQNMAMNMQQGETAQGGGQGLTSAQTGLASAQVTGGRIG